MSEETSLPESEKASAEAAVIQLPKEAWVKHLCDPANEAWLCKALGGLPPGRLSQLYRDMFHSQNKLAYLLVKAPGLKHVSDQNILEHLGRLRERRPRVLEILADIWVGYHQDALLALAQGVTPPEGASPQILEVGCWLWGSTDNPPQPTWDLVQSLLNRPSAPEPERPTVDPAELEGLKVEFKELQSRLHEVEHKKRRLQASLESLGKDRSKLEAEKAKLSEQLHQEQHARKQVETGVQTQAREAENKVANLQRELNRLAKDLECMRSDLFERDREIVRLERHSRDARTHLEEARDKLEHQRAEFKELQARYHKLEQRSSHQAPLPGDLLEQALVVDYPNLGADPAERLIHLLELYRAFLKEEPHPLLEQHTNWLEFQGQSPLGILLLGLEQMLLDGLNLPLTRFLRMPMFRSESLLYALIHRLSSPRLEEA